MVQVTLVLPFALPAPEFAPDLVRALQAPALAALVSRTASHRLHPADPAARALPHELWLARSLGLAHGARPAFAVAAMRGFGLEPGEGTWLIVNPAHIEIARSHLLMADLRGLSLSDDDSRALFDSALPYFAEAGHELRYGDANTWFMRADDWTELDTASPDAAVGMNLTDWMPLGQRAIAYRKLQNEIQMLWYTHPANAAREARGLPAVNAFWVWGAAGAAVVPAKAEAHAAHQGQDAIAAFEVPGWLSALATRKLDSPGEVANGRSALLVCGNVAASAIAADWSGWLHQMQRLETALFAPLLAALKGGRIGQVRLVLSHRNAHAEFVTTPLAQRKFWRRPTLDRLI